MRRSLDLSLHLVLDPGLCAGVGMRATARAAVAGAQVWCRCATRGRCRADDRDGARLDGRNRRKQREAENAKLKRFVADVMLANVVLQDLPGKP